MMIVKQSGIMYHFLSLWYDSTWNWTPISRTIDEHYNIMTFTIIISTIFLIVDQDLIETLNVFLCVHTFHRDLGRPKDRYLYFLCYFTGFLHISFKRKQSRVQTGLNLFQWK